VTDAVETFCYRHPDRPTGLSCTECNRPICPACSIDAAVGQRCPECLREAGPQQVITARELVAPKASFATSPVTFSIIAVAAGIQVLAFVAQPLWDVLFEAMAMWPPGVSEGEWWRLISVITLHAGLLHVGFNMLITYQLGPQLERQLGSLSFLSLFLATAAAGSAFAFFLGPPFSAGVGASGAVFGLVGAWLAPAVRRRGSAWGRQLLNQLGGLLLINAAIPFFLPRVSWQAHLGGLIAGFVIGWAWTSQPLLKNPPARIAVGLAVLLGSVLSTQL
jgi:rhomboid protease GluP